MTTLSDTQVWGRVWITRNGKNFIGHGRVELLKRIGETGSISKAAKSMKMSYKSAWDAVDAMSNAFGQAVVATSTGGKGGGGAQLTAKAHQVIAAFEQMELRHAQMLQTLTAEFNVLMV
ncbi:MAG: winged helix-turn-helix domain-containing protein [Sulfuriferula sp.]|nr:winged helix-turn-helix domain-containing protein [Sulfuriferula sp.]